MQNTPLSWPRRERARLALARRTEEVRSAGSITEAKPMPNRRDEPARMKRADVAGVVSVNGRPGSAIRAVGFAPSHGLAFGTSILFQPTTRRVPTSGQAGILRMCPRLVNRPTAGCLGTVVVGRTLAVLCAAGPG